METPVGVPEAKKERAAPGSFADHFSRPRRFRLSMSPPEREHIVGAYTSELGRCYEQAIKERGLEVLANIDPEPCRRAAEGLGLPAPEPTVPLADVAPSPALSQVGRQWPVDGRIVGVVAAPDGDPESVRAVRVAALEAGLVPPVVAPTGGVPDADGGAPVAVRRTFVTARSTKFDALLLAGVPARSGDANGARDAKAGDAATAARGVDPRVLLMASEAFRHAKAIAACAGAEGALEAAGVPLDAPGAVVTESGGRAVAEVLTLLSAHRVWERFPATPAGI